MLQFANCLVWLFTVFQVGVVTDVQGAIRCASPAVLASWQAHALHSYTVWDDIHSWARTCFLLGSPSWSEALDAQLPEERVPVANVPALTAFWAEAADASAGWRSLFDLVGYVALSVAARVALRGRGCLLSCCLCTRRIPPCLLPPWLPRRSTPTDSTGRADYSLLKKAVGVVVLQAFGKVPG